MVAVAEWFAAKLAVPVATAARHNATDPAAA
jgi:hypothetical protein